MTCARSDVEIKATEKGPTLDHLPFTVSDFYGKMKFQFKSFKLQLFLSVLGYSKE